MAEPGPVAARTGRVRALLGTCLAAAGAVILAGLVLCAVFPPVYYWLVMTAVSAIATSRLPASPLVEGLDPTKADFTRQFDQRVKDRFPVGTSVTALTDELKRQGFTSDPAGMRHVTGGTEMVRHQGNVACDVMVHVGWTADPDGRVATISGWLDWVCL